MGTVPVAPSNKRILLEGEKRANGFIDRFMEVGFKRIENANRTIFVRMIDLII